MMQFTPRFTSCQGFHEVSEMKFIAFSGGGAKKPGGLAGIPIPEGL
jgi:hypothetical protein